MSTDPAASYTGGQIAVFHSLKFIPPLHLREGTDYRVALIDNTFQSPILESELRKALPLGRLCFPVKECHVFL